MLISFTYRKQPKGRLVSTTAGEERLKENVLHCQAEAALQGHDLGPFELVKDSGLIGYQARCKRCGRTTYASAVIVYSVLEDTCKGGVIMSPR